VEKNCLLRVFALTNSGYGVKVPEVRDCPGTGLGKTSLTPVGQSTSARPSCAPLSPRRSLLTTLLLLLAQPKASIFSVVINVLDFLESNTAVVQLDTALAIRVCVVF
jgi:hypothetical protein